MGKIVISHRNLTPWPDRIFTKINFIYTNQFLSVIKEPTQLARKICEKKVKITAPYRITDSPHIKIIVTNLTKFIKILFSKYRNYASNNLAK